MPKIDILYINDAGSYGGAEYYQTQLAEVAQSLGWNVAFLFPDIRTLDSWSDRLRDRQIQVLHPPQSEINARLIHANGSWHCGFHAILPFAGSLLITEHAYPFTLPLRCSTIARIKTRLHRKLWAEKQRQWNRAKAIITVNDIYRRVLIHNWRISAEKIYSINNGVDMQSFAPRDLACGKLTQILGRAVADPVIFIAGRMDYQKGFDLVISALARLKNLPWHLVAVGDGPRLSDLKDQAHSLVLDDRISFTGYRTDLSEFLAAGDIFIQPSRNEAVGFALLEALACGLPSIATAVGGVREVVGDSEIALLIAPDDVVALTAAVEKLLTDEKLRFALRQKARQRIASAYTKEQMIDKTIEIYKELM